ncbi:Protein O-linked-mannose beta-1,4-N-acetylglucosaminyltransferase [Arachis hypogaea]|nr:Protein O-linked-mannose beta-1,4-N-acetylglucosaminyltransferase [Arachis hypogaea]
MMYNSIFAKSFSRYEQKKLGYGAFVGCLIIVLSLCTVFKPYIGPIHVLKLKLYVSFDTKMLMLNETSSFPQTARGKTLIQLKRQKQRKWSKDAFHKKGQIFTRKLLMDHKALCAKGRCRSNEPCYIGNHFHEFTDIIIPLFLTSRQFNGQVKFVVSEMRPWWISKYQAILSKLSNYEVLNIDKVDQVHCFTCVNVGLKRYPKELSIDPQKYSYSIKDFRSFLRDSYSVKRVNAIKLREEGEDENNKNKKQQPRLLILSRRRTRSFTNTAEIAKMARSMGFEAIVMEAGGSMSSFANVVNSCDVLLGVHGAGLTNIVFLPENAVLIQIVPHGGFEWLAKYDFELPSKDMGLKYLDYKISAEESTLIQQYPQDHMIIKHPPSIGKLGWERFKSVYLEQQNVMLDLNRFRPTLQKALELLQQ